MYLLLIRRASMNKQLRDDIFQACRRYFDRYGYFPTVRELCTEVGVSSTSTVSEYLQRLEISGLIETNHPTSPRAYRFCDTMPRHGLRRYNRPSEDELRERIEVQQAFNMLSDKKDVLDNQLKELQECNEHDILKKLLAAPTDNKRCELLKNLEYYGNKVVMRIFDELEA